MDRSAKRPQLHLVTVVVGILLVGLVLWFNTLPQLPSEHHLFSGVYYYGWPYFSAVHIMIPDTSYSVGWNWFTPVIYFNLGVSAIPIIFFAAYIEHIARHCDRRDERNRLKKRGKRRLRAVAS